MDFDLTGPFGWVIIMVPVGCLAFFLSVTLLTICLPKKPPVTPIWKLILISVGISLLSGLVFAAWASKLPGEGFFAAVVVCGAIGLYLGPDILIGLIQVPFSVKKRFEAKKKESTDKEVEPDGST